MRKMIKDMERCIRHSVAGGVRRSLVELWLMGGMVGFLLLLVASICRGMDVVSWQMLDYIAMFMIGYIALIAVWLFVLVVAADIAARRWHWSRETLDARRACLVQWRQRVDSHWMLLGLSLLGGVTSGGIRHALSPEMRPPTGVIGVITGISFVLLWRAAVRFLNRRIAQHDQFMDDLVQLDAVLAQHSPFELDPVCGPSPHRADTEEPNGHA